MIFHGLDKRMHKRARRKAYRAMLARWEADGGDQALRFDYPLEPESLVVDLGGYEGQWASDLYARARCRILVLEPVERFADRIRERFARNPDIEVFAYGLGGASRTETIHVRGASSSTHKRKGAPEHIRLIDVRDWFAEHEIADVALMKVNIEGGEFELLERLLETGLISRIRDLQVQFHWVSADSDRRMAAIQEQLRATHESTYQYRYIWENWRRRAN